MKIFGVYDTNEIKIEDFGLKKYINLDVKLIVKTRGRNGFGQKKRNSNIARLTSFSWYSFIRWIGAYL